MIEALRERAKTLFRRAERDEAGDEAAGAQALKRNLPLVPAQSIAGKALVTVIAIMTFLAALAAGAGALVADASRGWTESIAQELTVQVKPAPGRNIETDVQKATEIARRAPGVVSVRAYTKGESERLLEPWLGGDLDLDELPVPRLIVLQLDPSRSLDQPAFRAALNAQVPFAVLDDHKLWLERLAVMARTLVATVGLILVLVLIAMALAVGFATRGAMAGNAEIINVLHFVGAADRFVAREFQRHFLRLGLRGGLIGAALAIFAFAFSSLLMRWWAQGPGGDEVEALFGSFSLGPRGYVAIACIAIAVALLTAALSRAIVFRHLRSLA